MLVCSYTILYILAVFAQMGLLKYCKFEIFARVLFSRNFAEMKSLRNGRITPLIIDVGQSCTSREFLASQICLLALFAKIRSR